MLMLTLAISCSTTSNLPWFMDLTFQVPMQYYSSQHQTLLPSPVTSTTGCCFCFGSISSFSLELFLYWSPVAYRAPTDLGSSSFGVLSFCLFILFMEFSRQEYWSGLPFPSPVDHVLSALSTVTRPSWVALHGMAHSFTELDKAVVHVIRLVSFLWLWFPFSALWWRRIRGLWKLPDGRDWLRGELGPILLGRAKFSKSLIQFSIDEWGCVPSLLLAKGQTMVVEMKIMATSFKRSHACTAILSAPALQQATTNAHHHRRLLDPHGQVWVSLLWGHCSFLLGPGAHKFLFVPAKSWFPSPM